MATIISYQDSTVANLAIVSEEVLVHSEETNVWGIIPDRLTYEGNVNGYETFSHDFDSLAHQEVERTQTVSDGVKVDFDLIIVILFTLFMYKSVCWLWRWLTTSVATNSPLEAFEGDWASVVASADFNEVCDSEMEGESVTYALTTPLKFDGTNVGDELLECDKCGGHRNVVGQALVCPTCGFETKVRGSRRRRVCRGGLSLVRSAQSQFPGRLQHRSPELARQQVYVYMQREATRLGWTVAAKKDLPVLAAMAMLPSKEDFLARELERSAMATELVDDYESVGLEKEAGLLSHSMTGLLRLLKRW